MNDSNLLSKLREAANELGYTTQRQNSSDTLPYDTLSIIWEDEQDKEQSLDIIVQPLGDELDGSVFVQFYAQYPFLLSDQGCSKVVRALPAVNNELPLGHFDISADKETLYFRYVLALPLGTPVTPAFLSDVADMCIYAYDTHSEQFQTLCSASV